MPTPRILTDVSRRLLAPSTCHFCVECDKRDLDDKAISKVLWCKSILTAVRQNRQPKRDSFRDSQPVKVVQQRRHVVKFPGSVDPTRRSVQDGLKSVYSWHTGRPASVCMVRETHKKRLILGSSLLYVSGKSIKK